MHFYLKILKRLEAVVSALRITTEIVCRAEKLGTIDKCSTSVR